VAELTTLHRPVGLSKLEFIRSSGFREFPPRLPEQPFFYPVVTEKYPIQIARDWNTKDAASGFADYVLRFEVRTTSSMLTNNILQVIPPPRRVPDTRSGPTSI